MVFIFILSSFPINYIFVIFIKLLDKIVFIPLELVRLKFTLISFTKTKLCHKKLPFYGEKRTLQHKKTHDLLVLNKLQICGIFVEL